MLTSLFVAHGCNDTAWNDPYTHEKQNENTLYTAFTERPKHLDPAISYTSEEAIFTFQIYEPPLQYHYLKRPYQLTTLSAQEMPEVTYQDKNGNPVTENDSNVAYSVYRITLKKGMQYQPHPAFAKNASGEFLYHHLTPHQVANKHTLQDFAQVGTREVTADDYVYQIKRLADPSLNSPILGLMETHIAGLKELSTQLQTYFKDHQIKDGEVKYVDLRQFDISGVKALDRYQYEIKIIGKYPQFQYWLAMPFFVPMPWEAIQFYAQDSLLKRNISLDWYPVGSGPFLLTENNPNLKMVLEKNPNFHGEVYPSEGESDDEQNGLLKKAGKSLPFLDKIVFILEKENIPFWSKYLQGYYDQSAVTSDNYDQALQSTSFSNVSLSDELTQKGVRLSSSVLPILYYWGFNMLDETVGGYTVKKKKLRQAIAIAMDMEEYVNIFLNGSGVIAQSVVPPGIFGHQENLKSVNQRVYDIDTANNSFERKSIKVAKKLLAEAGYPNGIDPKTKNPLILYLDVASSGSPTAQAQLSWLRKQFKKIGIELIVRATQYNRFQSKVGNGDFQLFSWGWAADYPDPENFLFIFDSQNSRVKYEGENTTNYANPEFDKLFNKMKTMPNTIERQEIISKLETILQEDAPWFGGYHPKLYSLRHQWVGLTKPNGIARYSLKYISIDSTMRDQYRQAWNHPIVWPLSISLIILLLLCMPAAFIYWKKTHRPLVLEESKRDQP
ncbi:ABC transporter substrate-binding protein [Candidatus Berkiella aquae]|uniref:ABC transporter substrate-binding protein n=1 Tax=Candidatus Berkiella aquae TaxID=295108 RepID=A0AAE3L7X5_9GAMM|nr:ABC transporter substrate-binding protein [Candidatus Berkiella aquae]